MSKAVHEMTASEKAEAVYQAMTDLADLYGIQLKQMKDGGNTAKWIISAVLTRKNDTLMLAEHARHALADRLRKRHAAEMSLLMNQDASNTMSPAQSNPPAGFDHLLATAIRSTSELLDYMEQYSKSRRKISWVKAALELLIGLVDEPTT